MYVENTDERMLRRMCGVTEKDPECVRDVFGNEAHIEKVEVE